MPRWLKHLLAWTAICCLAAAPSFVLGTILDGTIAGMCVGVAIFIAAYTSVSLTEFARRLYAERRRRRAIQIGYATRIALSLASASVFLEVGLFTIFPDLMCGAASVNIAKSVVGRESGFAFALLATLLQGTATNLVLGIYTLIVYGICRATMSTDPAFAPRGFEVLPLATPVIALEQPADALSPKPPALHLSPAGREVGGSAPIPRRRDVGGSDAAEKSSG